MRAELQAGQWDAFFVGLAKLMSEPTKILRAAMATRGYRGIVENFREERGPDGSWAPRSAWTQKYYAEIRSGQRPPPPGFPRAAFNPNNRLLQLTGHLRKTLMPSALTQNTVDQGRSAVLVFSPAPYSGQHDEGDPSRSIPARPFMWLNDKTMDDMATIVLKMMAEGR